jgi:hypothetical protein
MARQAQLSSFTTQRVISILDFGLGILDWGLSDFGFWILDFGLAPNFGGGIR